jgi:hypothetical protein
LAAPAPAFEASYYEANIAYCIAVSSSSAPASKRKFAAYSMFLSQARYASAALCFGNPYDTKVFMSSISYGDTYMEPGGGCCWPPPAAPGPPAPPPAPPNPAIGL